MRIPLTQGQVAIVDECDAHLAGWKWSAVFNQHTKSFYAKRNCRDANGKSRAVALHQAIIGRSTKGMMPDHINGDTLDNRRSNLRFIPQGLNRANSKSRRAGKTVCRFPGVRPNGKKFQASITIKGKFIYLGQFQTQELASAAYQSKLAALVTS